MFHHRIRALIEENDLSIELREKLEQIHDELARGLNIHNETTLSILQNSIRLKEDVRVSKLVPEGEALETMHFSADTMPPQGKNVEPLLAAKHHIFQQTNDGNLGRYQDLGLLGKGGMGEVRRVRDPVLNRILAMKIIHREYFEKPEEITRFIEEAQVCAQLQHPSIVPVHELGELQDGRLFFTMQEVKGRRLSHVIKEVHHSVCSEQWQVTTSGWSFRRLIDAFGQICSTVAYAHEKGVIHRDIKPSNMMVGHFGEILVLDWGLAKVSGQSLVAASEEPVETHRSKNNMQATRSGSIAGTPAYMSPEQAKGEALDVRSDIYSLGTILYEILTGHPPYVANDPLELIQKVRSNQPIDLRHSLHQTKRPSIPEELIDICEKSMQFHPRNRYPTAYDLGKAVQAYLDGARKKELALAKVAQARSLEDQMEFLGLQAELFHREAASLLSGVHSFESEHRKMAGWSKEDEAAKLEQQMEIKAAEWEQFMQAALLHKADLVEAHQILAAHYRRKHKQAEESRDRKAMLKAEVKLRHHTTSLPSSHSDRSRHFAYLRGQGKLSLYSNPEGAEVWVERFKLQNRRLVATQLRHIGETPLVDFSLAMGSYLVRVRKRGHREVVYPVLIEREQAWNCVSPHSDDPYPISLPKNASFDSDAIYIPAGWFICGGDPDTANPQPQKKWLNEFMIQRFPVTNREYVEFLNDLLAQGLEEQAVRYAPRERGGVQGEQGAMSYCRHDDGTFFVGVDVDGDSWNIDWPVLLVDWYSAVAYCEWYRAKTGENWRLPTADEWEKAARGVDGRYFPWGDHFDPSWCCVKDSQRLRPLPSVVNSFPVDASVYGVRGMAGNVRDWTSSRFGKTESSVIVRGGCWVFQEKASRISHRGDGLKHERFPMLGFRLARDFS